MQSDRAEIIRKLWGDKPCNHPNFDKEYNRGYDTGDLVCTQCGNVFSKAELEKMYKSDNNNEGR